MDFWSFLQVAILFAAVLGLAAITARFAAVRMQGSGRFIKVLEVVPLGTGKCVALLRVAGKLILLGSADRAITHLATLEESEISDEFRDALSRTEGLRDQGPSEFLRRLTGR